MGKQARERRLAENEAGAQGRNIRTSPQKLNLVAQAIRGKSVDAALAELTFSKRRVAGLVKKVLQSAIANAENNHDLDVDALYVAEASVGKNMVMKRMRPRARGRMARILKPFSEIRIVVRERGEAN
ncbi:MAG: 50S ribosomal protein L22 [Rhodospirillaceae bacterium]|jgi:large subunit ribosomal protein L22|nr:50S ribosomal protein L22 [Rhodospirillaceae bacterium]MBT5080351.1 50S ribosomal protein L22 [Rhodospirillaceae bacterium]MBT5522709.1 50S ribosomal protein L22 [Rhodospirillaceae bacterium]MBT5878503.1 50S ribosomal protein L22 [Rhodospirillaceae bacterium]MBT6588272.1 50S ribosomal protein L22 [Rhodospirillaceae bacterium]